MLFNRTSEYACFHVGTGFARFVKARAQVARSSTVITKVVEDEVRRSQKKVSVYEEARRNRDKATKLSGQAATEADHYGICQHGGHGSVQFEARANR